jgi:pre-mRNA-splicing factor 38A
VKDLCASLTFTQNTTIRGAKSVHGTNPQFLIETTIRNRIWDSIYWKVCRRPAVARETHCNEWTLQEHCFALTAETLIDKAVELKYIGGTYGNTRPTEFLCLALKLLQLQPEREIILEYLRAEEFKCVSSVVAKSCFNL